MSATRGLSGVPHRFRERFERRPALHEGGADILAEDVVRSFGPINALRRVSLAVEASEFVTITGPSGSGKSTLLNLIGSLDRPDSGTITVAGVPIPEPRHAVDFRRRIVGFVFQDNLLLPYLSAQSNIEAALLATGMAHPDRQRRSSELLAEVGLSNRSRHSAPSSLVDNGRRSRSRGREGGVSWSIGMARSSVRCWTPNEGITPVRRRAEVEIAAAWVRLTCLAVSIEDSARGEAALCTGGLVATVDVALVDESE